MTSGFIFSGGADFLKTARLWRLIIYMAWSDVRARYKRSVLGPLWITIGTAIGVVGLGFIWSALFKMERATFIPLLTLGLILWQFMSSCITESSGLYYRQANIIRNLDLPLSIYPAQLILRQLINLAHNFPLFFIVILVLRQPLSWQAWLAVPGFLLVVANLYWISLLIGIMGARFRDFEYMVSMIIPLLMFFTPVMYQSSALPFKGIYIWLNPLADMIEVVRRPLLGQAVTGQIYMITIGMLATGGIFTFWLFSKKRSRIAFWV